MLNSMPRSAEIANQPDSGVTAATPPLKRVVGRVPEKAHPAEPVVHVEPVLFPQL
jgi:hypothetical protein